MDKSRVISLIRKCLAKGDKTRNNSLEEVEVALAMAQKLMTEHNISLTEVQFNAEDGTLKEGIVEKGTALKPVKWRRVVPHVVDILCNTEHFIRTDYDGQKVMFVGLPDDVEMAGVLLEMLLKAIQQLRRGYEGNINDFSYGAAVRLLHRAKETKKTEVVPTKTSALMIVKGQEIQKYLAKKELVTLRTTNPRRSASDYHAGYQAGARVPLNRPRRQLSY